ncbi:hypothetical protein BU14_0208s0001 [Porphyra umbilicalis]|uniref:Uncharacterized protein n=1 Tax=Porphyra umbilicalis TaxID=2786 RepID=A0A1X6P5X8_PORUM|nr:hypothetical protein BU14_0208s0001 [Porphyra umbilicalis]|eukprot:OSX76043.1 hypothetical protein BU14_0208s0001 [Porphyra umbilicalis]
MDTMAWTIPADVAAPPPPPLGLLEALSQAEAAATAAARAATPTAAAAWDEDGGPGSPCSPHTVPSTGGTFWETAPPADVEPTCGRRRPTIEAQVRRAVAPRASPAPPRPPLASAPRPPPRATRGQTAPWHCRRRWRRRRRAPPPRHARGCAVAGGWRGRWPPRPAGAPWGMPKSDPPTAGSRCERARRRAAPTAADGGGVCPGGAPAPSAAAPRRDGNRDGCFWRGVAPVGTASAVPANAASLPGACAVPCVMRALTAGGEMLRMGPRCPWGVASAGTAAASTGAPSAAALAVTTAVVDARRREGAVRRRAGRPLGDGRPRRWCPLRR